MKYFLFNHVGSLNHGCEAIVRGTVNIVDNADKNAQFVLSSFAPETDSGITEVEKRTFAVRQLSFMEKLVSAFNIKVRHSEEYALRKMYSDITAQAQDCDICVSIGGDTYCYGDNHGIQVLTRELKKSGKKVVLWGASIGEEDLSEEKLQSLKDFDAIFTRESLTYELLKNKNANENIFLNPDPAFCMERDDVKHIEGFTKENTLGLNVSPLVEGYNPEITKVTSDFIRYVLENTTLNILLVPHVVEKGNNDYEYMTRFYEQFKDSGRVEILPPDLNAKQYKGYIANTRFFIGARTHATIAAYSSGVPTAVLGYSVKSRGLAKDLFGEELYVLNSRKLTDAQPVIDTFNSLVENENEIKGVLMKKISLYLRNAMQMGDKLSKL
ncbi:MAG: polysaccharide pyruvyl transferase family protein [Acutalibacteraceae bacterium]|nr:polysaccharide pyruvyl transferase family protein [Acutalibacteraceae bacterium]